MLTVIRETNGFTVIHAGEVLEVASLPLPDSFSALHWDGSSGEVEFINCQERCNEPLEDTSIAEDCLQAFFDEKERIAEETRQAFQERKNSWEYVRENRDDILKETDWMVLPDSPLNETALAELKAYRQALRDIPSTFGSPAAVEWPEKPSFL
ncbi:MULTISPECIES: tail fiber assembly protein [unclassified Thioalkalivibrio]|uniref:tail fiber assembly protein n=1 Tax=unclassified Thioalkalivibrio TaxID=2621013 RepID=UPI00036949F4|nr:MULTISPECIES: tail fiber assembly protein [unclassified Thioalkalivibrio]